MFRLNTVVVSFVLAVLCLQDVAAETRIVGGKVSTILDHVYLIQVINDKEFCGGSLIKSDWVMTAAHCVHQAQPQDVVVVGGTSTAFGSDGQIRSVRRIHVAPFYDAVTQNRDLALLKLQDKLTGSLIRTITIGSTPAAGSIVKVAGWGLTTEGGQMSTVVREVSVPVVATEACAKAYKGVSEITSNMFCAATLGKDSCSGDSGGPVVYKNQVVGVVSFGFGCARPDFPGVYTNLAAFKTWIAAVTLI